MTTVDLRITLTSTQRTAWQTIRPVLKAYLPKALWLYRHLTPEQRAQVVAHSPAAVAYLFEMFDAVGGE